MGRYESQKGRPGHQKASAAAILKLALVGLALMGLVGLFLWVSSQRRSLDPETLCPASPDSIHVLLVDVTDPMNLAQRQDFLNQLERLRSTIPRYGKLSIFKVDATNEELLQPIIERCNPGTPKDVSEWTGNPAAAAERWREGFEKPLGAAFETLSTASGADTSPIFESIQSVALTELKNQENEGKPLRITVASDLLQNTNRLSFYGRLPRPEEVLESDAFRAVRTDLREIEVELWMLQRSDASQSQPYELRELWEVLLRMQGADVPRIYNVSG